MKVLLAAINAKYIHSNPAVYSLKAYVAEYGEDVEIAEYTINHREEAILADLYEKNPDVIAFSCYIWNWHFVQPLLRELPKVLPNADLWLGGPEVSYHCEKVTAAFPQIRGIIVGEGEVTFAEILSRYKQAEETGCKAIVFDDIPGLYLPGSGSTGDRKLTDLSEIPFFYHDMSTFENRIVYYESSRGCPFRCSYCLSSIDKSMRLRPLDTVRRELAFFLEKKVPQVKFIDRTFNCNHAHAKAIWQFIKENDNGVTNFHFEIAADLIDEEELSILRGMRPGLVQLEIGVQSTNERTICEINRVMDYNKLRRVVEAIESGHNIHVHLDLIAGLPYEDLDSFKKSFDDVYAMRPNQLQLGFLKVLKGAPMYEKAAEYGLAYTDDPPYEVLRTKWLSYADVLALKRIEEMVELYYNSNQFVHTVRYLESLFERPYDLYAALAKEYEEKGYFVQTPARSYRYEILLKFACGIEPESEEVMRELLTFDLYLREKCKSRPPFARDLAPYKEELRVREADKKDHIEVFYHPVWDKDPVKKSETPYYVRFSYEKRDPLTQNAEVTTE